MNVIGSGAGAQIAAEVMSMLCRYTLDGEMRTGKHFSMIAGGTGITPCYQARHPLRPAQPLPLATVKCSL